MFLILDVYKLTKNIKIPPKNRHIWFYYLKYVLVLCSHLVCTGRRVDVILCHLTPSPELKAALIHLVCTGRRVDVILCHLTPSPELKGALIHLVCIGRRVDGILCHLTPSELKAALISYNSRTLHSPRSLHWPPNKHCSPRSLRWELCTFQEAM